ncbi:hypothetical protein BJI67_04560 [Acidihalobacter aeolianus]|uniref:Phosphotyrosine protein phosphatase I domain-containing protein n=1 Tax=Acidihalobacter aeolianus TaxID=2792603 RepID=A0A1D8K695_9GAMM|nr:arsenate reductase ArsC [Acidihalobacter aeolianus]AOV16440.1 hypothetical protein BJI67_04560 [Acidihalobacter aeolianus]
MSDALRVLFLCSENACRSQMAEAILRHYGGADFEVFSAGTEPGSIHPLTYAVMAESGLDLAGHASKPMSLFEGECFDYIITVCDRARDRCPTFPGDSERIHWRFDDPAESVEGQMPLERFRRVRDELRERIRLWVTAQRGLARRQAARSA